MGSEKQRGEPERSARLPFIAGLMGVWRRGLLVTAEGRRDEGSDVYWLQSRTLCGDIRRERAVDGALSPTAFAGRLSERSGIFRWERELASYPPGGPPDEGRLSWDGEALREDGVHSPYLEIWLLVARPGPQDVAAELRHARDGRAAWLLALGSYRFFAQGPGLAGPDGGASFAFSGPGSSGGPLALHAGAPFDEEALVGFDALAAALADGAHIAADNSGPWRVAALERPSLFAGQSAAHF